MTKRVSGALFFVIILCISVASFVSFGMAQDPGNSPAVEVLLLSGWCSDDGNDPPDFVKDVASCSGEVLDDLDEVPYDPYTDHFAFTIHNGYPGYECTFNLTVHNAGTETLWIWIGDTSVTSTSPSEISVSGVSFSSIELASNGLPGDSAVVIFTVYVMEGATPGTTYDDVISGTIVIKDEPEP